jgi:protein involved in polysaccharide export with SLBB domain
MRRGIAWPALLVLLALVAAPVAAQEYTIGVEDVLTISVYLHPELERTVTVDADGAITFPPLGTVKASGLTPKQLGDRLADRLATYLRQTTAVTVTVTQYVSRSVFLQGAVAKPGRYGFERMPSLIEVIGQAGGALPGADLSRVEIIRREGTSRRTIYADVSRAMRQGVTTGLPELTPGDIIIVPAPLSGVGGQMTAAGEGAGVLGEVTRPGLYPVGAGQDLWVVLAAAGGLTPQGNLSNVRVITRDRGTTAVVTVNLKQSLSRGGARAQIVRSGDVVFVSRTGSSQFGRAFGGLQALLSTSTDIVNLVLLRELIEERNR